MSVLLLILLLTVLVTSDSNCPCRTRCGVGLKHNNATLTGQNPIAIQIYANDDVVYDFVDVTGT